MSDAIAIAVSGLQASSMWIDAVASNIANARDTAPVPVSPPPPEGAPSQQTIYQPVSVAQSPLPGGGVDAHFSPVLPSYSVTYDPSSPFANAQGMVAMPNVDIAEQMVNALEAVASYKANIAVIKTADKMAQDTLNLTA